MAHPLAECAWSSQRCDCFGWLQDAILAMQERQAE
jgi:hypothetical protein